MTDRFTPGPWFADELGRVWRWPPSDLYENGGGVAGDKPVATAWLGWYGEKENPYPILDNARLIAAAPDLLEACRRLLGTCRQLLGYGACGWSDSAGRDVVFADEVIRRATGEKEQEARDVTE